MTPYEIKLYYVQKCKELEDKVLKILFSLIYEKHLAIARNVRKVDITNKFLIYAQKHWIHSKEKNYEIKKAIDLLYSNGLGFFLDSYAGEMSRDAFEEFKNLFHLNKRINLADMLKTKITIFNGQDFEKMELFSYLVLVAKNQYKSSSTTSKQIIKININYQMIANYLNFKEKLIYDMENEAKINKNVNFAGSELNLIDNFISMTYNRIENNNAWKYPKVNK